MNNISENILNQVINFSLLSYKDGLKTLIKESKLKKEIKIKIIKYKNYEYNNDTLNLLFDEIKDYYPNNNINIDNNNNININENNDLKEIINMQNNKIISLTNEINELKKEFSDYKFKMDNIINLLEKKINDLEKKNK